MRDSQWIAGEQRGLAEHAHRAGEQHGQGGHLTGNEQTRLAGEHSRDGHFHESAEYGGGVPGLAFGHDEIAALAYELWLERAAEEPADDGKSAEHDWFEAVRRLRARSLAATGGQAAATRSATASATT